MAAKKSKQRAVKPERKDEQALRDRIIKAAFGAFMERGYAGTSTLEIATRARVSKRELYALFENKQAMLAAGIAARTAQEMAPELPEARDRPMLGEILTGFGTRLLHEASDPHVVGLHRLAIAEYARAPEVAHTLHMSGRAAIRKTLGRFFARAQGAGLIGGREPEAIAGQFLGLLWRDLMVNLLLGVETPPDEAECRRRARAAVAQCLALNPPAPG